MQVTLELPDEIARGLETHWGNLSRHALQAVAIEGYGTGALSKGEISRMLGFETRTQVDELLKRAGVPLKYTVTDLEMDLDAHRSVGLLPPGDG